MTRKTASLLTLIAITVSGAALHASDSPLPLRKAGKWEQKTVMEEGGQKQEQTLTICIDAGMERNTALASDADHKSQCSKYEVKRDGDEVVIDATCKVNGRDVDSRTEMSGDFQSTFDVKISSTTSGIQESQTVSINRLIEQRGKYLSESCGELKAGEAMGTDGTKVMVQ